jgi:hypothetical protein
VHTELVPKTDDVAGEIPGAALQARVRLAGVARATPNFGHERPRGCRFGAALAVPLALAPEHDPSQHFVGADHAPDGDLGGYDVLSGLHLDSISVRQDRVSPAYARVLQIGRALAACDGAELLRRLLLGGGVAIAGPLARHRQIPEVARTLLEPGRCVANKVF